MDDQLKNKTLFAIFWNLINKFGTQVASLIPTMVLSRLLNPSEYGLIAISGIFSGFVTIFIGCGLSGALIQKKDASHKDYCSVFYFNVIMSLVVYAIIFFSAPLCASFFGYREVCSIMRVMSIGIVISSLGAIHGTLLQKELEFKKIAIRNLWVVVISAVIAIVAAFYGIGYWTLVIQALVQASLLCILNWSVSTWRPTFYFSFSRLKQLWSFGSRMLGVNIVDYVFGKSYDTIIGKNYNPAELSYYNKAYSTTNLFVDSILGALNTVLFPAFSKMQDDLLLLKNNLRRFIVVVSFYVFLLSGLLISLSEPLFHFLYSSKWDAVIPFFIVTCVWGTIKPFKTIMENGLLATGHSPIYFYNNILSKITFIVAILLTYSQGIMTMLVGQFLCAFLEILFLSYFFNRIFSYNLYQIIKDSFPGFIVSLVIAIFVDIFYIVISKISIFSILNNTFCSFLLLLICGAYSLVILRVIVRFFCIEAYEISKTIIIEKTRNNRFASIIVDKLL